MGKVSIGIRGWRFDEATVFDERGELRPLEDIPEDERNRLVRLSAILGEPCDACWLRYGSEGLDAANPVEIVYGEPLAEVLLCADHEPDFLFWFRERDGSRFAGTATLPDRFHEWFDDGGRAPEGYAGIEHVDEAPDRLPEAREQGGIEAVEQEVAGMDEAERAALDLDLDDLDV